MVSDFKPAWYLPGKHLQTIIPSITRQPKIQVRQERINTPDSDFLDLDWSTVGSKNIAIICHGLEGSSKAVYVRGMMKYLNQNGIDCLAWNYRGCSGVINHTIRYYHSGSTDDLNTVVEYVSNKNMYEKIYLIGFSVGGNIVLKYGGEKKVGINPSIKKIVSISCPCHLASSAAELDKIKNRIYLNRFLNSLKPKIIAKIKQLPFRLTIQEIENWKTFYDFDTNLTAPLYGFKNAMDYWEKSSSLYFLNNISVPTYMLMAANDPFLSNECFPLSSSKSNSNIHLEITRQGGHVGFCESLFYSQYYSEKQTLNFLNATI